MLNQIVKVAITPIAVLGGVIGFNANNNQNHPLCDNENHCTSGKCADCEGNKLLNK